MARGGFVSAVIKISRAIDSANKKAQKEAERAERDRRRLQAKANRENEAYMKVVQKEYERKQKEQQKLQAKRTKDAITAEKAEFDNAISRSKEQYRHRCEARYRLVKKFIKAHIK